MAYLNLQKLCLLLLSQRRWELHQVNLEWMWGGWFLCYNILKEDASLPPYSLGSTSHWKMKILFFHTILCLLPDFHPLSTQCITCVFSIIVIERGEGSGFERMDSGIWHCSCSVASWVWSLWKSCGIWREPPFSVTDITCYHPISDAYLWARDLSYVNSAVYHWVHYLSYGILKLVVHKEKPVIMLAI